MTYRAEALADHHDLAAFRCGNDVLDSWLRDHARTATGQATRAYVIVDPTEQVIGYFALAPHTVDRDDVGRRLGRGAPRHIPAILLAKLTLTDELHGQGLGSELLVVALETIVGAARRAGGRLVVVDAIDDAAHAFYLHHEFEPVPGHPGRSLRKLSTIARALGQPWP